jgi:hypothetical protein
MDMNEIPQKFWWLVGVLAALATLHSLIGIQIKNRRCPLGYRLAWSVVVLVPFLGPLLYGALFQRLRRSDVGEWSAAGGWGLTRPERHGDVDGPGSDAAGDGHGGY